MSELPAFEREPYRTQLETQVVAVGEEDGRPYAVLADTILYPEGGGQPPDHGFLGTVAVLDVQKRAGELRHYLAGPAEPGPVSVRLHWPRRSCGRSPPCLVCAHDARSLGISLGPCTNGFASMLHEEYYAETLPAH